MHTRAIVEFEQAHPDACLRLRYEDLAADPDARAEEIFAFLGEESAPGITHSCFTVDREQFGPSDHKIWATTNVTAESVGRGTRIPAQAIPPAVLGLANGLLEQLSYPLVDQTWNEHFRPRTMTGSSDQASNGQSGVMARDSADPEGAATLDELEELLTGRLSGRLAEVGKGASHEASPTFTITATVPSPGVGAPLTRWWHVDPKAASITRADMSNSTAPADAGGEWGVTGHAQAWRSVLVGELNVGTAIRHGRLRYTGAQDEQAGVPIPLRADARASVLTRLLTPAPAGLVPLRESSHA